jgi:hypothetical protein
MEYMGMPGATESVNPRVSWHELPSAVRVRIEAEAGTFVSEQQVGTGHSCLLATVLYTETGCVFLKGVPTDRPRAVWTQANEAAINGHLDDLTARLLFHAQSYDWDILGFDYLGDHHHADLSPESSDLPAIAKSLHALSRRRVPAIAPVRTIEDRWGDYARDRAHLLAGSALAHTDLHRHNIMVGATAKLIDWAWPTLAAPWFDTACIAVQLIQAGHSPKDAELWCQELPAYAAATDEAISAFTHAARAMWQDIAEADPRPWKIQVATAAALWAEHRGE